MNHCQKIGYNIIKLPNKRLSFMKKFAPLVVVIAIIGLFVTLLNRPKSDDSSATTNNDTPTSSQGLTIVTPWEITNNDPSTSGFVFQRLNIAETLVDADDDAKLTAGLATQWQSNPTMTEWTVKLRDGVLFHDGSPLTADAVVKSLTIALKKPSALQQAYIHQIQAIDDKQVKFTLSKPNLSFPAFLAHATAIILAPSSYNEKEEVVKVIGTGAYQVTKIEPPQKIEQEAFADYWGKKASIKHITYLANSRSESRALLAQSKPDYLVFNLDAASLSRLQTDQNLNIVSKSIARTIQYKVNAKLPPFDDVKFRQILSRAIDRQGISEQVLKIDGGMANQILPPIFADWQINAPNSTPDYDALQQELAKLGYQKDSNGKLLGKDGKAIAFTLKTFSDRPELPIVATALQAQFAKLGIDVEVAIGNFSDIPASHQNGTLQMALYARNYGLIPDPLGALMEDFAPNGSDWGVMNWHNQTLNDALNQINDGASNTSELQKQIAQIIYDEQPITPVVYYQQNAAANNKLSGLQLDAFERSFRLNELSW